MNNDNVFVYWIKPYVLKTVFPIALLYILSTLGACSKSNSNQPAKRDTTYQYLLTAVSFLQQGNLLVKDSFEFDQNGMISTAFYYSNGNNAPSAVYGVTLDPQTYKISAFDYSSHDNLGDRYTKFDVGYGGDGRTSSMIPESGGSLSAADYQVQFRYGQNIAVYNAFGYNNLFDTLIYSNGNMMHRQHYGSNTTSHDNTPTTMDYHYTSLSNPYYNAYLNDMGVMFMKCPTNGAGREYDYLADVISVKMPDVINYVYGPADRKLQWGVHNYTWQTDTSGRVVSGDLVMNDSIYNAQSGTSSPFIAHYNFTYSYKLYMVIR